jgi:hypothetical protein
MDAEKEKIHEEIIEFLNGLDQRKNIQDTPTNINNKQTINKIQLSPLPADQYLTQIMNNLKQFINQGQTGVFISFQRPANNLMNLLYHHEIEPTKLGIIDIASEITMQNDETNPESCESYIPGLISDMQYEMNNLKTSFPQDKNRFVMIDSINTMALYLNQQQIMQLITQIEKDILTDGNTNLYMYGAEVLFSNQLTKHIQNYLNFVESPVETRNKQVLYSSTVM